MEGSRPPFVGATAAVGMVAMAVFAVLHQVLVEPSAEVLARAPLAIALAAPIIASYRSLPEDEHMGPFAFGLAVACGLAVQAGLMDLAVDGRDAAQGPHSVLYVLGLLAAPALSGFVWAPSGHLRALLPALGAVAVLGALLADLPSTAPEPAGLGTWVSALVACTVGAMLAHPASARREPNIPRPHAGWIQSSSSR